MKRKTVKQFIAGLLSLALVVTGCVTNKPREVLFVILTRCFMYEMIIEYLL